MGGGSWAGLGWAWTVIERRGADSEQVTSLGGSRDPAPLWLQPWLEPAWLEPAGPAVLGAGGRGTRCRQGLCLPGPPQTLPPKHTHTHAFLRCAAAPPLRPPQPGSGFKHGSRALLALLRAAGEFMISERAMEVYQSGGSDAEAEEAAAEEQEEIDASERGGAGRGGAGRGGP